MKNNRCGSYSQYTLKDGVTKLWRYRLDLDSVSGKRKQVGEGGFKTKAQAKTACDAAIAAYQHAKDAPPPAPPQQTMGDWMREWLVDFAPQRVTTATLERYQGLAGYILNANEGKRQLLANTPLVKVDHNAIEDALAELSRMPGRRAPHLSSRYVRDIFRVLSVCLEKASTKDRIAANPCYKVEVAKVERHESVPLTPAQITALRQTCAGEWLGVLVDLALASGARRAELLGLEWDDIDWMDTMLYVRRSLERTKAFGIRTKRPKNGKVRKFHIGPSTVAMLRFHREQQTAGGYDGPLVFPDPRGGYRLPHVVSQQIIRRMRKAGITVGSLHVLRHSHASYLLSNNVPLPVVSARLGHSSVKVTAETYSHMLEQDDRRASDAWERTQKNL